MEVILMGKKLVYARGDASPQPLWSTTELDIDFVAPPDD